jgi:hypothetical protein
MSADLKTSFLKYYIRSLAERTRVEKTGTKFGFDWIIYNLALADGLIPVRLPFFRSGPAEISKTKTEAEFGVDLAFLSQDRTSLRVFVLKDEELTNTNWKKHDFDPDIRAATTVDLTASEFGKVREVKIILAYNKDEDDTGIRLYERLTKSLGRPDVQLSFERWNLTTLTEAVKQKLLTPSLLPQRFFSLFSYICAQFSDFHYGSDEWTKQLIPNWRRFLGDVLRDNVDERTVRLIPVALLILREVGGANPTAENGWIDRVEWAVLAAWQVHQTTTQVNVKVAVFQMWVSFYVVELERYYTTHSKELSTQHSLEVTRTGNYLDAIIAATNAFWHIGRLGILAISFSELLPRQTPEEERHRLEAKQRAANWLVGLMNANPAAQRPLIDLHHVELYLIWKALWQAGRQNDIGEWLNGLFSPLLVRRIGAVPLPFIEGGNSIELVLEHVARGEKPPEFSDQSSVLLLALLELFFSLEGEKRNELIEKYYRQLVLGRDSNGQQFKNCEPINLMGWKPPDDWAKKVLNKSLANEGESQTLETFEVESNNGAGEAIASRIKEFVLQSRKASKTKFPDDLPVAAIVLACLKNRSPLPPEIWRIAIFGELPPKEEEPHSPSK